MRLIKYIAVLVLGGLSLAVIATSETLNSKNDLGQRAMTEFDDN